MMSRQRLAEATQDRQPLAEPIERQGPTYAHDLARHRNERMTRTDCEWAVGEGDHLYLRDKISFNRWNTEEISKRHERERQECSRNNHPRPVGPD